MYVNFILEFGMPLFLLQEALSNRLKDCDDINPGEELLQKIATTIEEELFSLFRFVFCLQSFL